MQMDKQQLTLQIFAMENIMLQLQMEMLVLLLTLQLLFNQTLFYLMYKTSHFYVLVTLMALLLHYQQGGLEIIQLISGLLI